MSPVEQSTAMAYQIMCEEHLYWQVFHITSSCPIHLVIVIVIGRLLALWRYVHTENMTLPKALPALLLWVKPILKMFLERDALVRGLFRPTAAEATGIAVNDLRALSYYLGNNGSYYFRSTAKNTTRTN